MKEKKYLELAQAVIDGEKEDAEAYAKGILTLGIDPLECINQGLTPGIRKVGDLFAKGDYFLPN